MEHHENGIDSQRGIRARNGGQRMVRWPFTLTAGCAIVSAVFALIAGRKD